MAKNKAHETEPEDIEQATDTPEMSMETFIQQCSPEQKAQLEALLGVKRGRVAKPLSPEVLAAKTELDTYTSEHQGVVDEYSRLKEVLRSVKGVQRIASTKPYKYDPASGAVVSSVDGTTICNTNEEEWQSAMRAAGMTQNQVAGVTKSKNKFAEKPAV